MTFICHFFLEKVVFYNTFCYNYLDISLYNFFRKEMNFLSNIKIFSLGGLDEMGKNCYVMDIDNDIFVFDCGIKYANENLYGIDYIIPDFGYLVQNKDRIKGVF